jgi:ABC-type sugar transport system permease subunit
MTESTAARSTTRTAAGRKPSNFLPLVFLLPTILVLLVFQVAPVFYAFYLSMTRRERVDGVFQNTYVGTDLYELLLQAPSFLESLERTVMYAVPYIGFSLGLGLALALLLNTRVRGTGVYVVLLFMPWVLSDVVAGTMWRWLFQPTYGLVQEWLTGLGFDRPLYTDPDGAMAIVIAASIWQGLAFTTILSLGALQTIPTEVMESAAIDGAGRVQRFLRITLPLIRGHLLVMLLLVSIRAINSVGLIFATTGGGPGSATETASIYLLDLGWLRGRFNAAGAISVMLLGVNLTLTTLYLFAIGRRK